MERFTYISFCDPSIKDPTEVHEAIVRDGQYQLLLPWSGIHSANGLSSHYEIGQGIYKEIDLFEDGKVKLYEVDPSIGNRPRIIKEVLPEEAKGSPCSPTDIKRVLIRFGDLPKNGKSKNHKTGELEEGVSAYEAIIRDGEYSLILPTMNTWAIGTLTGMYNGCACLYDQVFNCLFEVSGEYIGIGSDGEPVLKDCKIIKPFYEDELKEAYLKLICIPDDELSDNNKKIKEGFENFKYF